MIGLEGSLKIDDDAVMLDDELDIIIYNWRNDVNIGSNMRLLYRLF